MLRLLTVSLLTIQARNYNETSLNEAINSELTRQSPINIDDSPANEFDEMHLITRDNEFAQNYGRVSKANMRSPNGGISLEFALEDEGQFFTSSVTRKWFTDVQFSFSPKQLHFHRGLNHKRRSNDGSEHTINGHHYDQELHIVSLNQDESTQHDFVAAVTGILF
jgi:hypothetical protein